VIGCYNLDYCSVIGYFLKANFAAAKVESSANQKYHNLKSSWVAAVELELVSVVTAVAVVVEVAWVATAAERQNFETETCRGTGAERFVVSPAVAAES